MSATEGAIVEAGAIDKYSWVGPLYEVMGDVWSFNQIPKVKNGALTKAYVPPKGKILIAGCGHGTDAIFAALNFPDAEVTVVDISPTMLNMFRRRKAEEAPYSKNVKEVCSDILKFKGTGDYDLVLMNFFLNVFSREFGQQILDHIYTIVKPGGHIAVGDWTRPHGNIIQRSIINVHWYLCDILFNIIGSGQYVHPIWDMPQIFTDMGLTVVERKFFNQFGFAMYETTIGQKPKPKVKAKAEE